MYIPKQNWIGILYVQGRQSMIYTLNYGKIVDFFMTAEADFKHFR